MRIPKMMKMMIAVMMTGEWPSTESLELGAIPWTGLMGYSDDEDETAELQRELEKIKRERAEKREQEVR